VADQHRLPRRRPDRRHPAGRRHRDLNVHQALGQTTASWQYTTAAPDGNSAHADVSSYTYTPGGQTATVTDNAGNTWSYACDLLGDKISATGPDTGSISYAYDNDGELTSSTDACGQVLTYTYDNLNRKTSEYSGTTSGTLLAKWAYDAATLLGGASTVIPAAEGKLAGTYTITYTSLIGLLQSTAYTADGGLPAETVGYSYDPQGGLAQSGGNTAYLDDVIYSPEGQAQRTTFGLYGKQLVQTYTSDPATTRLLTATTSLQTLGSAADTVSYTYSQDGSITSAPPQLPGPTSRSARASARHWLAVAGVLTGHPGRVHRLTH